MHFHALIHCVRRKDPAIGLFAAAKILRIRIKQTFYPKLWYRSHEMDHLVQLEVKRVTRNLI